MRQSLRWWLAPRSTLQVPAPTRGYSSACPSLSCCRPPGAPGWAGRRLALALALGALHQLLYAAIAGLRFALLTGYAPR
jgi:hypothetical protein